MSSLWSLAHKGRLACLDCPELDRRSASWVMEHMRDEPLPRLVNITDFAWAWACGLDGNSKGVGWHPDDMDLTPAHRRLWLEWMITSRQNPDAPAIRQAICITRHSMAMQDAAQSKATAEAMTRWIRRDYQWIEAPSNASHYLELLFFKEHDGSAGLYMVCTLFIDGSGIPTDKPLGLAKEEDARRLRITTGLACEVLTTMNTLGTEIRSQPQQSCRVMKPDRHPCSVWHTIHLPRHIHEHLHADPGQMTPELLEKRLHWVRAHRRDYRHGRGMFGRIRALVWVPEFQRGNAELGTVQQSYKITFNDERWSNDD